MEKLDLDLAVAAPAPVSAGEEAAPALFVTQQLPDLKSKFRPGATDDEVAQIIAGLSLEAINPFHKVLLPSKGVYYGWDSGWVEVRAMDQEADKILSTEQLVRSGQAIDIILRTFTRIPNGLDILDLLNGDRVYLLYYMRGITNGNLYEFVSKCGNCNENGKYVYNLNNLQETVTWYNEGLGPEPFRVTLPMMSKAAGREVWVSVRFPRGRDTQQIVAQMRLKNKLSGGVATNAEDPFNRRRKAAQANVAVNDAVTENLSSLVTSFMGNTDRSVIDAVMGKLLQPDAAAIRRWIQENAPGPDTSVEFACNSCKSSFTVPLPITESFFRQTQQ